MNTEIFEKIGLTKSGIKVYLALLKLGEASKGPLVKESKTSSSKIYEVTGKLIEKGLISYFLKNNVKYFKAASPSKIKDYIDKRQKELSDNKKELNKIIPNLNQTFLSFLESIKAEVYEGWKGLETVFEDMLKILKKGDEDLSFGANAGEDPKKTRAFYDRYLEKTYRKGIKIRTIMNQKSKQYFGNSKANKSHVKIKYFNQTTPSEINIYSNKVAIITLKKKPITVLITGKDVADSFRSYFETIWKISKNK